MPRRSGRRPTAVQTGEQGDPTVSWPQYPGRAGGPPHSWPRVEQDRVEICKSILTLNAALRPLDSRHMHRTQVQSLCSSLRVPFDQPRGCRIVQVGMVWDLVWYAMVSPLLVTVRIASSTPVSVLLPCVRGARRACQAWWAHGVRWSAHAACPPCMVSFTRFTRSAPVSALRSCFRGVFFSFFCFFRFF